MSDIPGVTLVPTVRRQSWHAPDDRWQCVQPWGRVIANSDDPIMKIGPVESYSQSEKRYVVRPGWCVSMADRDWTIGPMMDPPPDWTTTLRRIVSDEMDEATKVREMQRAKTPVDR